MKYMTGLTSLLALCYSIASICKVTSIEHSTNRKLRHGKDGGTLVCTLYEVDVFLGESESVTEVMCEDVLGQNFQVHGLNENTSLNWKSGQTVIELKRELVQDDSILINRESDVSVIQENDILAVEPQSRRRKLLTTGIHKVLVVRVIANGVGPSFTREQIGDSVFGSLVGGTDQNNLASQYKACSYGKLKMVPETNKSNVVKGVVEVSISRTASQSTLGQMQSDAAVQLPNQGISLNDYDHIMYCMPTPIDSKVAWSQTNGQVSVYNDKFCLGLSTQMHEVGHNLGMSHSGAGTDPYGDKSGYMGYSGSNSEKPLQCFNGAKSWQLGWYSDRVVDINPLSKEVFDGKLSGIAQYGLMVGSEHKVVVHVITPDGIDNVFVAYNRAVGMNNETSSNYKDKVLVTQGLATSVSWLLNSMVQQEIVLLSNLGFPRPLIVAVKGSGSDSTASGVVDYMNVFVGLKCNSSSDCNTGQSCESGMCTRSKSTAAPSAAPTQLGSLKSLTSPNASSSNGQKRAYGLMFDLAAGQTSNVVIRKIDVLTATSDVLRVQIWTKLGTCSGFENLDSTTWVKQNFVTTGKGISSLTSLSLPTPVKVSKGSILAVYIKVYVSTPGDAFMAYNEFNCNSFGSTIATDSNLSVRGGYIWSSTGTALGGPNDTTPRCFNGAIQYQTQM